MIRREGETLADCVRRYPTATERELAALLGCRPKDVYWSRWRDRNIERRRAYARKSDKKHESTRRAQYRRRYHKTKVLGGIGATRWSEDQEQLVIEGVRTGLTHAEIANLMKVGRGAICHKVYQLKKRGLL